ncbi:MAG: hypothetical protein V4508_26585 [Pseudomonadota bacterium]
MFKVTISLNQASAQALLASGYRLLAFKAVRNSDQAGKVVLWYAGAIAGLEFDLAWNAAYSAYATRSPLDPPTIDAFFPITSGQILTITDALGSASVAGGGDPLAITINNVSGTQFEAGLAQAAQASGTQPLSAFPLYGSGFQLITPVERILLAFSTQAWQLGQVVTTLATTSQRIGMLLFAGTGALLVDMGTAGDTTRQVQFDINGGWSWGEAVWGSAVDPTAPLAPLLILPDI